MAAFTLIDEDRVPEFRGMARLFQHAPTGLEVLSVENRDSQKCFGACVRTVPVDSAGAPHVLEHSVLSGSKRYPGTDAAGPILNSAHSSYVGAYVYPGKTCYFVSSVNVLHLRSVAAVLMDGLLRPELTPETFEAQAWHASTRGTTGASVRSGVVMNEMRAKYAAPGWLLRRAIRASILPGTAYRFDASGDPAAIPSLTYENLRAYHRKYYRPSNMRLFFYGDDDPADRLAALDSHLASFGWKRPPADVSLQRPFKTPRRALFEFDPGRGAAGASISISWMLGDGRTWTDPLLLGLLDKLLFSGPAGLVSGPLLEAGFGKSLVACGPTRLRQSLLTLGVSRPSRCSETEFESFVLSALREVVQHGCDPDALSAALNCVEMDLRGSGSSLPRGLALFERVLETWIHGGNPLAASRFWEPLWGLRRELECSRDRIGELVRNHLVDNTHRLLLSVRSGVPAPVSRPHPASVALDVRYGPSCDVPDPAVLSDACPAARSVTPKEDVTLVPEPRASPIDGPDAPIQLDRSGLRVFIHETPARGIVYMDIGFDCANIPDRLIGLVPILVRAILEMGTARESAQRIAWRFGKASAGLDREIFSTASSTGRDPVTWLFVRTKCRQRQISDLVFVIWDAIAGAELDNIERFRQLINAETAERESWLIHRPHLAVNARLRAQYNLPDYLAERMCGVGQLHYLNGLALRVQSDWPRLLDDLKQLRGLIVNCRSMLLNITADPSVADHILPVIDEVALSIPPSGPRTRRPEVYPPARANERITGPFEVATVGESVDLYSLGYFGGGSASVMVRYIQHTWLWQEVRRRGGAYNAFAAFDRRSGILTLLSCCDPDVPNTLTAFEGVSDFLLSAPARDRELERSILGALASLSDSREPDIYGLERLRRHLAGETPELLQSLHDEILALGSAERVAFATAVRHMRVRGAIVVMGNEESTQSLARSGGSWVETLVELGS